MIDLRQISLRAGAFQLANVSFTIPSGAYAVLMGKTGSGKTTLLEAICGLRPVLSGTILLNQQDITRLPPASRGIGFVPQEAALFRHLTVADHLAFALHIRRWTPDAIHARTRLLAQSLQISHLLDRHPAGLSGGEAQRVALGRALSFQPDFLCLDEPLSALDDSTRDEIIAVLTSIHRDSGVTVLHITHNRHEADRLATLHLHLHNGAVSALPPTPPGPPHTP